LQRDYNDLRAFVRTFDLPCEVGDVRGSNGIYFNTNCSSGSLAVSAGLHPTDSALDEVLRRELVTLKVQKCSSPAAAAVWGGDVPEIATDGKRTVAFSRSRRMTVEVDGTKPFVGCELLARP
jgi:hypothetical protein